MSAIHSGIKSSFKSGSSSFAFSYLTEFVSYQSITSSKLYFIFIPFPLARLFFSTLTINYVKRNISFFQSIVNFYCCFFYIYFLYLFLVIIFFYTLFFSVYLIKYYLFTQKMCTHIYVHIFMTFLIIYIIL